MDIITNRLRLTPFTPELIRAATLNDAEAYAEIGIVPDKAWPEPELMEALPHFSRLLAEHGITGHNSWLMLDVRTGEIVGSLGFLGEPDADGTLELGFGVLPDRRRQGFCEEAVRALRRWTASGGKTTRITAHCDPDNAASRALLTKLGFREIAVEEGLLLWESVLAPGRQDGPAPR